ncbi:MAG: aminoacyl-tRNA hydrolase [Planctomycetes bacterium]|nr:aminoacyl-tRNA hydrolase [Planctomycetota bacterium]
MAWRILIGLGNPGRTYAETRHNLGWRVVDRVAAALGVALRRAGEADVGETVVEGVSVLLVKPRTYMNLSGRVAAAALDSRTAEPSDMLVVVDDMSLPVGAIRLRRQGSDGGHNGLRSILLALGTECFPRLRVGIGAPGAAGPGVARDFVLGGFGPEEREGVERSIEAAAEAARCWLRRERLEGIMNTYNRKIRKAPETEPGAAAGRGPAEGSEGDR